MYRGLHKISPKLFCTNPKKEAKSKNNWPLLKIDAGVTLWKSNFDKKKVPAKRSLRKSRIGFLFQAITWLHLIEINNHMQCVGESWRQWKTGFYSTIAAPVLEAPLGEDEPDFPVGELALLEPDKELFSLPVPLVSEFSVFPSELLWKLPFFAFFFFDLFLGFFLLFSPVAAETWGVTSKALLRFVFGRLLAPTKGSELPPVEKHNFLAKLLLPSR